MKLPDSLDYVGTPRGTSYVSREVLKFLAGKPWDAIAASWVSTLRPRIVRHSPNGFVHADAQDERVTVFTEGVVLPLRIVRIEMECSVSLYGDIENGQDLRTRTAGADTPSE